MAFLMFPENAVFRTLEKATGEYTLKAFMHNGLIPAILLLFLIPGLVYGKSWEKSTTPMIWSPP